MSALLHESMRRLRLSTLLIAINVGLLLLAVTGVAFIAVQFLWRLADDQALARVGQAGTSAQNAISHSGQALVTSAEGLAERPAILSGLGTGDGETLTTFLTQFQQTNQLNGCALILDGRLIAESGLTLDWLALLAAGGEAEDFFIYNGPGQTPLVLAAWSPIPEQPGGSALVAVQLDQEFASGISAEVGLPVMILESEPTQTPGTLAALYTQVLESGEPVSARVPDPDRYLAVAPLRSGTGAAAGLIETELPATDVTRSLSQLIQTLLLLALVVALAAALVSLYLGRRLSLPLQALTTSAARIGSGDLTQPIPTAAGFEIGALSLTLEEMRGRLLKLTANLSRQQAESNAIVDGIVEGLFTVDRERRIQFLNPQAAAMLGIRPEAAIGRFCGDVLNPQGEGGLRPCEEGCPIIHARFRSGARATEQLRLADGRRQSVVITSAPPVADRSASNGAGAAGLRQIQLMRDETEEEATRRVRDAVLANISHEFRTPLSAQLASIEMLLDQLPDLTTDQIARLVIALQRGTLRLTQLIDNLLESVRIEAGRYTIRRQLVAMDEVIEQSLELTRPLFNQRQQEVAVDLPYPLPPILGDGPRLIQVFVNLLANANKFAPEGSTIQIGGQVNAGTVTIWIEDHGPGLPVNDGSAFGPFVRAVVEEPEAQGVGLGLWIVKSIVERHQGRVDVQSSAAGTQVAIRLPREGTDEDSGR